MKQITIENIVNSAPKKLILDTMYNVFHVGKEKKALIRGFRNGKLEQVPDVQLKTAFVDFLKKINTSVENFEEVESLEEFEELYNSKQYLCLGAILIGLIFEKNLELCTEAYFKFFGSELDEEVSEEGMISEGKEDSDVVKKLKKELEMNKTLLATIKAMRESLDNKDATIESLQKKLEAKSDSLESMKKIKKEKEREAGELKKDKKALEDKVDKYVATISEKECEIVGLKEDKSNLQSKLEISEKELETLKNKFRNYILVYGYNEECYDYYAAEDVLQPDNVDELTSVGNDFNVSGVYFRKYSIGRVNLSKVKKCYPNVPVEEKEIEELELMGYMKRNK